MLIKQLKNFFVGKCGEYQIFFVSLQRFLIKVVNYANLYWKYRGKVR